MLFLIDFSMDTVTLWLASKVIHSKIKVKRCVLAAGLGALISTVLTAFSAEGAVNLILGIVTSGAMCAVAFGYGGLFRFIKHCAVLWTVGMILGGIMTFLLSLGTYSRVYTADISVGKSSIYLLPLASVICSVFLHFLRRVRYKRVVRVHIEIGSDTVDTGGVVDSGNFLRDPISGDGVVIVKRDFFSDGLGSIDVFDLSEANGAGVNGKIRLIPVSGVGGSSLLVAVRPNKIKIDGREVRCLVALSDMEGASTPPSRMV